MITRGLVTLHIKEERRGLNSYHIEEDHHKVHMVDENLQPLCVHILHDDVLLGGVLVLEEELEDLLLVVDVAGVEDGREVPEEGEGGQVVEGVVLGQGGVNNPYKPAVL